MTVAGGPEMTCRELVELVSDYLEGLLSPAERERFERHLGYCDPCVEYVDQMRGVIAGARRLAEDDIDPGVRDHLLDAFREWRSGAGGAG